MLKLVEVFCFLGSNPTENDIRLRARGAGQIGSAGAPSLSIVARILPYFWSAVWPALPQFT
jgi:hypothetical protein